MPRKTIADYLVYDTPERLHRAAAEVFARYVSEAARSRGIARVALSGGDTPKGMLRVLAAEPFRSQTPWSALHLYWVDERCVAPDHTESNYGAVRELLLKDVSIPAENIHRMEGELPPDEAAPRYEATLRNTFRLEGAEAPSFDLVLLGIGEDGHTASIFPHSEAIDAMGSLVTASAAPGTGAPRVTLTWPVLNHGHHVVFVASGAAKAEVLRQVLLGGYDPDLLPAQLIRPESGRLGLLLDAEAAQRLPKSGTYDDAETGTLELTR